MGKTTYRSTKRRYFRLFGKGRSRSALRIVRAWADDRLLYSERR